MSASDREEQLGKAEWEGVCAKCHGMQGQGDYGPALAHEPDCSTQPASLEPILRKGGVRMPAVGSNWSTRRCARSRRT